jgi:hypothetical protein
MRLNNRPPSGAVTARGRDSLIPERSSCPAGDGRSEHSPDDRLDSDASVDGTRSAQQSGRSALRCWKSCPCCYGRHDLAARNQGLLAARFQVGGLSQGGRATGAPRITETLVAEFPKSDEESRSNSTETTMHGSGGSVERRVHDWNQVGAYSVRTPNRVHVAAGQYLYCTSPSTSPRATKPIVRLSRELFRLSPSTKHIPSGTFALG